MRLTVRGTGVAERVQARRGLQTAVTFNGLQSEYMVSLRC
jgi:hypothetical protein